MAKLKRSDLLKLEALHFAQSIPSPHERSVEHLLAAAEKIESYLSSSTERAGEDSSPVMGDVLQPNEDHADEGFARVDFMTTEEALTPYPRPPEDLKEHP